MYDLPLHTEAADKVSEQRYPQCDTSCAKLESDMSEFIILQLSVWTKTLLPGQSNAAVRCGRV